MLTSEQVARLADASAGHDQPRDLLQAIELTGKETIDQALLTVMRFDEGAMEVERLYSSNLGAYPLGGRKKKRDTAWGRQVLIEKRQFIGEGPDAIRAAFDDHETILGLGLLSVINMPVVFAGACRGTVNFLCMRPNLSGADAAAARLLSLLAAPALLNGS